MNQNYVLLHSVAIHFIILYYIIRFFGEINGYCKNI